MTLVLLEQISAFENLIRAFAECARGKLAANLNNAPSNVNTNIGFRCASLSVAAVRLGKVARVACGKSRAYTRLILDMPAATLSP